jgi:putative endonuclease
MSDRYCTYILASARNGTLYIGVTSSLVYRIEQHRNKVFKGFTEKYSVDRLVYYETYPMMLEAIAREKELKRWRRKWKIDLIEKYNPEWNDLSATFDFSDLR